MSTYLQLTIEVTTGDDLAFEKVQDDDDIVIVINPDYARAAATPYTEGGDHINVKSFSWKYQSREEEPHVRARHDGEGGRFVGRQQ